MFTSNGSVVAYRPANRVALAFRSAKQQADIEDVRRSQASQDEMQAKQLDHAMQSVLSAAERAARKYKTSMEMVALLLDEKRSVSEDKTISEGERLVQLAAIDKTIAEHRAAMVDSLKELLAEVRKDGDAEAAVAKDMARLEDEATDRRGLHARSQPRDDDGKFA